MGDRAGTTVTAVPGNHSVYVSQPAAVAELIRRASRGRSLLNRLTSRFGPYNLPVDLAKILVDVAHPIALPA